MEQVEVHPKRTRARVLLTSVFGPYAQDDEFGSRRINPMELYHNQVTRAQGSFSLRMFHRSWGIMMIQENISAPSTLLDFPTRAVFARELTRHHYDIVGISSIIVNVGKVREMCRMVRRLSPGSTIVVGGHVTAIPAIEHMIDADHIVRGDGIAWMRGFLGEDVKAPIRHPHLVSAFDLRVMGIKVPAAEHEPPVVCDASADHTVKVQLRLVVIEILSFVVGVFAALDAVRRNKSLPGGRRRSRLKCLQRVSCALRSVSLVEVDLVIPIEVWSDVLQAVRLARLDSETARQIAATFTERVIDDSSARGNFVRTNGAGVHGELFDRIEIDEGIGAKFVLPVSHHPAGSLQDVLIRLIGTDRVVLVAYIDTVDDGPRLIDLASPDEPVECPGGNIKDIES